MEHRTSLHLIILHLISKLPEWLIQGLPIATLLALLFSFDNLSKRNEITAMKAAGVNIWWIIAMFLIIGFVIGVGSFAVGEFIVPKTSLYSEIIKKERIQKKQILVQLDSYNKIIALPNNIRMTIGHLNAQTDIMRNIIIEKYNNDFDIQSLTIAEEATWKNGSWILRNGVMRDFDTDFWDETYFKNCDANINITPEDLEVKNVHYGTMNIWTFKKYINRLKIFGQAAIKEKIVLNARFSAVFAHVIVMMIGIPFSISSGKTSSKILSFTLALCAIFAYWGTQAIGKSLGENLIFPPFIAAWFPNIVFSTIGICLLVKIKK
jgi:lipopolysaccharide export system permease protein